MAQPNRGRRPRGRNNNSQNRQKFVNKNQAFDSSGPQGRVRGNAQQIFEKYQALARDAQAAGEHTLAEAHFQHAEHYLRLYNEMLAQIEVQRAEKAKRDEERMAERGQTTETPSEEDNPVVDEAAAGDMHQPSTDTNDEEDASAKKRKSPAKRTKRVTKPDEGLEASDADLGDSPQPSLLDDEVVAA